MILMQGSQFDDTLTGHETHDTWMPIHVPSEEMLPTGSAVSALKATR